MRPHHSRPIAVARVCACIRGRFQTHDQRLSPSFWSRTAAARSANSVPNERLLPLPRHKGLVRRCTHAVASGLCHRILSNIVYPPLNTVYHERGENSSCTSRAMAADFLLHCMRVAQSVSTVRATSRCLSVVLLGNTRSGIEDALAQRGP